MTKTETAERRRRALQLRQAGASLTQIGEHLGVSESRACRIVQDALAAVVREPADEVRQLELARLDQLWVEATKVLRRTHITVSNGRVAIDPRTEQPLEDDGPVLNAIDRLLKIQERRAKLLGLDAPSKLTVLTEDAVDAEIRRLVAEVAAEDPDRAAAFEAAAREIGAG